MNIDRLPLLPVSFTGRLPHQVRTFNGVVFDPHANRWAFRDGVTNVSLDFTVFAKFSETLIASLKSTLVWYAENWASKSLVSLHRSAYEFHSTICRTRPIEEISEIELLNYRATLSKSKLHHFGKLSGFLKKWNALGYAGVSQTAIHLLKQIRTPGGAKGVPVLTWNPEIGPFTDVELEGLQVALNDAYGSGLIDGEDYLLSWLIMSLGSRPVQFALMKVCDLHIQSDKSKELNYTLNVPRAKQPATALRGAFTGRVLVSQIGDALARHVECVKTDFKEKLTDPSQAPMFPSRGGDRWSQGFEYHAASDVLTRRVKATFEKLNVTSERNGGRIPVTSIRFRRTLGTRAAAEGHGELVIAELLDHSDTQHVGVYAAASPAIIERIDRAIAMDLAPLAQAFAGVLIRREVDATRGYDPASRIVDLRIDRSGAPMGSCGTHSFCGFSAPIACYTCKSFQPWLDGPHEAVLSHLLDRRQVLLDTTDKRVASINDRTILAVAEVIRQCNAANQMGQENE